MVILGSTPLESSATRTPNTWMISFLLLAALQEPRPIPAPPRVPQAPVVQGARGAPKEIAWFSGTWDDCLAKAAHEERLVFVELWMPWCPYCKKLGSLTLTDASVVAELGAMLCFSVDTTDPANAPIARRFQTRAPPTLVFLEPSGELRDVLSGYIPPKGFLDELQRIKRNERTLTDLRSRLARDEKDIEARYELALKLKEIGELRGYKEEIEAIRLLDPKGRSVPARCLKLVDLRKEAELSLDPSPLYAFLGTEEHPKVLYEGWYAIWQLEGHLARTAAGDENSDEHRLRTFEAAKKLWPYVPRDRYEVVGNNIAWSYYEEREFLSPENLLWALSVAQRVAEVVPDEAYVIDTLACCYFAVGRREDSLREIQRCIELEPLNFQWKERLSMFESKR